jgi:hypothetical protein
MAVQVSAQNSLDEYRPSIVLGGRYWGDRIRLPGVDMAADQCQMFKPLGFCEDGHVQLGRSSCERRGCPDHWREWVKRGTTSAVARLAAYRQAQPDGPRRRLLHLVLAPELDAVPSADQLWSLRTQAQEVAKDVGVRGGLLITHPFRTSDTGEQAYAEAVAAGLVPGDYGRWRYLRDLAGSDWSRWETAIEVSPHFHCMAAAEDIDGQLVAEWADKGWVVKNVRSFDAFWLRKKAAYEDMARAVYYLRTHALHAPKEYRPDYCAACEALSDGHCEDHQRMGDIPSQLWFGEVHPASFDPLVCTSCRPRGSGVVRSCAAPEGCRKIPGPEGCRTHGAQHVSEATCAACEGSGRGPLTASEAHTVQQLAGEVMALEIDEEEDQQCQLDDCEAQVHDMADLRSMMAQAGWWSGLGRVHQLELQGLKLWWFDGMRVPPPEVRSDEAAMRRWLAQLGRSQLPPRQQPATSQSWL